MKVVFVSPWNYIYGNYHLNGKGIEQQIAGISKILENEGIEVYILTRSSDNFKNLKNINIVEIHTNFGDSILSRISYSKNIAIAIKKINPDVINLTDIIASYFASKLKFPKIYTAHMLASKEINVYNRRHNLLNYFFSSIIMKMEEYIVKKSNKIVVLNSYANNYFKNYRYKTILIPNGINTEGYNNCSENKTILYAGRLSPIKNIETLIYAFSEIENLYPSYKLQIIGSGLEETKLKKISLSLDLNDRIEFIPDVENEILRQYLCKCTIFVLPSLFETFGIVTIEAMASGKPVIASDIPGPRDIITHSYDGFLFESRNINQLKKYLMLLLENPSLRTKIGSKAKETAKTYSFEQIGKQYMKIYYSFINYYTLKMEK